MTIIYSHHALFQQVVHSKVGHRAKIVYLHRALILGPDDTPYATGAFVFDILLPPEYPNKPPLVSASFISSKSAWVGEMGAGRSPVSCEKKPDGW